MIRSSLRGFFALAVAAVALCSIGTAYGQYSKVGTTSGGGNIVTGVGTSLGNLGPGFPLSGVGTDSITFEPGSIAVGSGQDTVYIETPGNLLTNYGMIYGEAGSSITGYNAITYYYTGGGQTLVNFGGIFGGSGATGDFGDYGGTGGNGIYFYDTTVNGFNLMNSGRIVGGVGGSDSTEYGGTGGIGIYFDVTTANGIVITNGALIAGGAGGAAPSGGYGPGGIAIYVDADYINGFTLNNNNSVLGGAGSSGAGTYTSPGGVAISLYGEYSVSGVSINNTGFILGGPGGSTTYTYGYGAYGGGDALDVYVDDGNLTGFTLTNGGTIAGGNGSTGGVYYYIGTPGGNGVYLYADGNASNLNIANSGLIQGGNGGAVNGISDDDDSEYPLYGTGGYGIYVEAYETLSNVTINNTGSIIGGNASSINGIYYALATANGGAGVYLYGDYVAGVSVNNGGLIQGGNAGSATPSDYAAYTSGTGGYGLGIEGYYSINGVMVSNTGSIIGGNGGSQDSPYAYDYQYGGPGGAGVDLYAPDGSVSNVAISNWGTILGGSGGSVTNEEDDYYAYAGGNGGAGIAVYADSTISGLSIYNAPTGVIAGGNGGACQYYNYDSYGVGGNGLDIEGYEGISGVAINNAGSILGGNGGNAFEPVDEEYCYGGFGGNGIYLYSDDGPVSGVTISNWGSIIGGNGGTSFVPSYEPYGYYGGYGGDGIYVYADTAISGLSIYNAPTGVIAGGNGGNAGYYGGYGGDGIFLEYMTQGTITNYGVIRGGNGGSSGYGAGYSGDAGYGIYSVGNGLTINNYGAISAGSGLATAATPGFPNVAIYVDGNNNTINLGGHSSVNGTLEGAGTNNVLNLNFTGVSPAELANLKAQLAAQGYPATNNFTGSFTLRGQTYYIDPLILNLGGITSYESQAQTPNQYAIGVNLDSLAYNPVPGSGFANLLNAIDARAATSGGVPQALEALSPQGYEIYGSLAIANANEMVLSVDKRLNNLRDGSESIDTTGLGGGSGQTTTAGYDKDGKESKNIVQPSAPEKRWGFFASGDGLLYRGDPHDVDLQSGKSDNAGAIAGVDGKVGENAVVGLLAAYNNSDATFGTANSNAKIDSYSGGVYGSWHDDGFYANGLAAYTRNDYSSTRNIVFPGFSSIGLGSTHGDQATVNVDGGYDWHATDRVTLGPVIGAQFVNLGVNGFNEVGGSAADLAVGRQEMNSLQSRVGFRADYHAQLQPNVAFATELTAEWQHEYLDDSRAINADFIGTGLDPFSVQTSSPLRDAAVVSLGVNFTFHDRLTLFGDYSLLMWDAGYFEQTFSGGLKISF